MGHKVFLNHDMNVDMPATKENPAGRVVQMKAGWVELDDELANHPIFSRLISDDQHEARFMEKLVQAEDEHRKAVAEADHKFLEARTAIQHERTELMAKLSEEHAQKESDAAAKGMSFNEPYPDKETRMYMARTAPAWTHAVPAASMVNRPTGTEQQKKDEDNLPSEKEVQQEMEDNKQEVVTNNVETAPSDTRASSIRRVAMTEDDSDADDSGSKRVKTKG